ncbi:TIGR03758 family integrating conjugative element protein [Endozoicomonas sp. ALC066]|uniref:TIGR03758 family integrating conjugative element protein n=1 Tax=Endozoicomonas sp. ALC066 TaxID=3403078 RepID=UPI003BB6143D
MNDSQINAFFEGSGETFTVSEASFLFQGLLASVLFLWLGWTCIQAYRAFSSGDMNGNQAGFLVLRGVFMLTVLLYLIAL